MLTLILRLSPVMARRVAKAADVLQCATHEDVGLRAVGELLDRTLGKVRGRRPKSDRALEAARKARR